MSKIILTLLNVSIGVTNLFIKGRAIVMKVAVLFRFSLSSFTESLNLEFIQN